MYTKKLKLFQPKKIHIGQSVKNQSTSQNYENTILLELYDGTFVFMSPYGVFRVNLPEEDTVEEYWSKVTSYFGDKYNVSILGKKNVYFPVENRTGYRYYSDSDIEYVSRKRLLRGLKNPSVDGANLTSIFEKYKARGRKARKFPLTRIPHPNEKSWMKEGELHQHSSNDSTRCTIL